jgi:hypothetical protein
MKRTPRRSMWRLTGLLSGFGIRGYAADERIATRTSTRTDE